MTNPPERHFDEMRTRLLLSASRRLGRTLLPSELFGTIYEIASEAVEGPGFFLAMHNQARDTAKVVLYADGNGPQECDISYRGSDSEVFRNQSSSLVNEGLADSAMFVLGDDGGPSPQSAVTAPIQYAGELLGAISVQSYETGAYTDTDLHLLEEIADIAGVAVHNSRQFAELDRRRNEAEKLEEIGRALASELDPDVVLSKVVDAVQDLLNVDGAAVWLCELEEHAVCRVAASGGDIALPLGLEWELSDALYTRVAEEAATVIMDDLQAPGMIPENIAEYLKGGSAIGVPVIVGGHVEGILTAGSREARRFADVDTSLLKRLSDQVAVALGNARLHADLHALSLTDPLTNLANRRRLQIHLEHEIAAARRGRPLAIAVFDIDRFKHYNDTFGHLAGDEILKAVARVLHKENRAMNLVARYGGDEFVSVLTDADLEGVRHYAVRVTDQFSEDETLKKFGISVSVGGAAFDPESMASINDVLRAADADMYRAKADQADEKKAAG